MKIRFAMMMAGCAFATLTSGCAAMFHGSTQQVAVRSNVQGAELFANEAYIGKDNTVTTFHKNKNYTLVARKAGCTEATQMASKSFDATTLLGILIDWGIISVLIVDGAATGAWNQFDQTSFVLDPRCPESGPAVATPAVPLAPAQPAVYPAAPAAANPPANAAMPSS